MFERIQKMKKSRECTVQYVHSNPNTLLLTSCGRAPKVQQWVLTLKLSQEPKIAMKLREVRLQKGPRGLGLRCQKLKFCYFFIKDTFLLRTCRFFCKKNCENLLTFAKMTPLLGTKTVMGLRGIRVWRGPRGSGLKLQTKLSKLPLLNSPKIGISFYFFHYNARKCPIFFQIWEKRDAN